MMMAPEDISWAQRFVLSVPQGGVLIGNKGSWMYIGNETKISSVII